MSVNLERNAQYPGASNTSRGITAQAPGALTNSGPFKYYEVTYAGTGQQETIYLPGDFENVTVILNCSVGTATLLGSTSPPDVIGTATPAAAGSFVTIITTVTAVASTALTFSGYTAISVSLGTSSTAKISVRC